MRFSAQAYHWVIRVIRFDEDVCFSLFSCCFQLVPHLKQPRAAGWCILLTWHLANAGGDDVPVRCHPQWMGFSQYCTVSFWHHWLNYIIIVAGLEHAFY